MINLLLSNLGYKMWQYFGKRCRHPNHKYLLAMGEFTSPVVPAFTLNGHTWYTTENLMDLPLIRIGAIANEIKRLQISRIVEYLSGNLSLREALDDPGELTPRLLACIYWHEGQSPYELDIDNTAPLLNHPIATGIRIVDLLELWKK